MKTLFDKLMDFKKHKEQNPKPTWIELFEADNRENSRLRELCEKFFNEDDLIMQVCSALSEDKFKIGDKADDFFSECANQVFFVRMEKAKLDPGFKYLDPERQMKLLHPLWNKWPNI